MSFAQPLPTAACSILHSIVHPHTTWLLITPPFHGAFIAPAAAPLAGALSPAPHSMLLSASVPPMPCVAQKADPPSCPPPQPPLPHLAQSPLLALIVRSSVVHAASHKVRVAMIGTARAVPRDYMYIRIDCGEFLVSNTSRLNSQYILYK